MEKSPSIPPPPPGTLLLSRILLPSFLFRFFHSKESESTFSIFFAVSILLGRRPPLFCFPLCAMRMILSDRMNYNPGMMTEGDSCTIWSQKPPFSSKRRVFLPFEAVSVCSYSVGLERGRARWLLVILQESWPGSPNSDTVTVCVFYFGGLCSFLFVSVTLVIE